MKLGEQSISYNGNGRILEMPDHGNMEYTLKKTKVLVEMSQQKSLCALSVAKLEKDTY